MVSQRTRREIRRAIGHDLQGAPLDGGMRLGTAAELTENTLIEEANIGAQRGQRIYIPVSDTLSELRTVTRYDDNTGVFSFAPDLDDPPDAPLQYELWDQKYHPRTVDALINQAIIDAQTNGVLLPATLDTAYLAYNSQRIKAPADWEAILSVEADVFNYGIGSGIGYGFFSDLQNALEAGANASADSEFYPFYTTKVTGLGVIEYTPDQSLGMYDGIGWEVAGHFVDPNPVTNPAGAAPADTKWRFLRQPFDPYTAEKDSEGNLRIFYDAGVASYVLNVYLYRESAVEWAMQDFTIWPGSGEIELPITAPFWGGIRLRLQGGKGLSRLEEENAVPDVPESYIRMQALVSLLRSVPSIIVQQEGLALRREWEDAAERERRQLRRMQGARLLR